ncbi:hypothetical protein AVEN_210539-1, partial [Araneus ventricosus]
ANIGHVSCDPHFSPPSGNDALFEIARATPGHAASIGCLNVCPGRLDALWIRGCTKTAPSPLEKPRNRVAQ